MTKYISIAAEFSTAPAGRFKSDGPFSGEVFRDRFLIPALWNFEDVTVDLDGTAGYSSAFLEEVFGGLVRSGFSAEYLRGRLHIKSARQSYLERAWKYINEACP